MAYTYKVQAVLSGWGGAPGVNSWYFTGLGGLAMTDGEVATFCDLIEDFYGVAKAYIVNGVHIDVEPVAKRFQTEDGTLQGLVGTGTRTRITSVANNAEGKMSRATQCNVALTTDAIVANRVLRGRHFIGPLNNIAMGNDGHVTAGAALAIGSAYDGMLDLGGAGRLVVWSQPKPARTGASGKPLPAQEGVQGYVQSAVGLTIPGTLRSRKV